MCHVRPVPCHLSTVTRNLPPVTGHLSLIATTTDKDPPPTSSPTVHGWLVPRDQKKNQSCSFDVFDIENVEKIVIQSNL